MSIINTWKGEGWTSCQNITSVLLTIVAHVFNNEPILNEPGVSKRHPCFNKYHKILRWGNYKVAFHDVIKNGILPNTDYNKIFYKYIDEYVKKNYKLVLSDLEQLVKDNPEKEWIKCNIYNMRSHVDFQDIQERIKVLINDKLNLNNK